VSVVITVTVEFEYGGRLVVVLDCEVVQDASVH